MKDLKGRLEKLEDKVSPKKQNIVFVYKKEAFYSFFNQNKIEMLKKEGRIEEKDNEVRLLVMPFSAKPIYY